MTRTAWMLWVGLVATAAGCSDHEEATCEDNGRTYASGAHWDCSDGCNYCSCSNGSIGSTDIGCWVFDAGADAAPDDDMPDAEAPPDASTETTVPHGYVPAARCDLGSASGEGCTCAELWDDGPRFCATHQEPATACTRDRDECCTSADCDEGTCVFTNGGDLCCSADDCGDGTCNWLEQLGSGTCFVERVEELDGANRCVVDECSSDADCPNGFCGTLGVTRECIDGTCRTDADCTQREGGSCQRVGLGCCGGFGSAKRGMQTTCVYPGDGCTHDIDCPAGSYCGIRDGFAACRRGACEASQ